MSPNLKAFLDTLAHSEIGSALLAVSDNGYNVLVGSTPSHPLLFDDYSTHPNIYNAATNSTAAGRYQLLHRYYLPYKTKLGLPDFSPESQDAIAIQQIKEAHALPDIEAGRLDLALVKTAHLWASLPTSTYGQHVNKIEDLRLAYSNAGGVFA